MKRFVVATIAILALGYVAVVGADDPTEEEAAQLTGNCGEIKNRNSSSQFGRNLWLEYIVETARPMNSFDCPWLSVSVEAWVVNIPGSAMGTTDVFTASVRKQVPVPHQGEWQTNGRHYRNYLWFFSFPNGETSSKTNVVLPAEDDPRVTDGGPRPDGAAGLCDNPEAPCDELTRNGGGSMSPIIIDVGRDGYDLTSLEDGVFFDLDADGSPELVSWTRAFANDAFLALDRNGNGRIDDGSELFGNNTPTYPSGARVTASNGFEALKFLESPAYGSSQRNELIDARDAAFSRLLLWTDANHNGISEPDELKSVASAGLQTINTDYRESRKHDRYGNEFRQRAKAIWADGHAYAYDVWLRRRP
jgi:hypothetical protein